VPDHVFSGAAKQDMLEAGRAMRRSNDQVRARGLGSRTNLIARVADLQRGLDLNPLLISLLHEIAHLFPRGFFGLLHEAREIVSRVFVTRDVVLEMDRMKKDKRRIELFG
jgi:hypothetical protein